MKPYTVYHAETGAIRRCGATAEPLAHPLEDGEALHVGAMLDARDWFFVDGEPVAYSEEQRQAIRHRPPHAARWDVRTGRWIDERTQAERAAQEAAASREKRRRAYPSIEDQLDALWHAMDRNILPRVEPMYSQIKAVKAANPL